MRTMPTGGCVGHATLRVWNQDEERRVVDQDRIAELERRIAALEHKLTAPELRKVIREYERRNGPGSVLSD
jgi:hypothetical protein